MITLSNGQYIEASSSTTNISLTVSGTSSVGEVTSGGILAEGFFMAKRKIFTSVNRSSVSLLFANTNQNTDTILTVWIQGSKMFEGHLFDGESASFDGTWKRYDANGIQMLDSGFERITVSDTFPSNPSIGDLHILI